MEPDKDEYFRKALIEGYRARSAYKLLQIDKCFDLFKDVKNVIDLCSAPGSWSQVISNKIHNIKNITQKDKINLQPDIKIASVDLSPIKPIPGVTSLVADITDIKTCEKLMDTFQNKKVDLIVCDGAHDVSGMVQADFQLHLGLITACIHIILQTLKENGSFVAKIFDTWGCQIFLSQFRVLFKEVQVVKPHSSRSESYECFAVCRKYTKIKDFDPLKLTPYLNYTYRDFTNLTGIHKLYIPFFVLGHVNIKPREFVELCEKYGDILYEKNDLLEELFREDDFFRLNLDKNKEDCKDKHQDFLCNKLLNKGKLSFGVSRKLLVTYLNKDCTIDFYKTLSFGEKSHISQIFLKIENTNIDNKDELNLKREEANVDKYESSFKKEESNFDDQTEISKTKLSSLKQEGLSLENDELKSHENKCNFKLDKEDSEENRLNIKQEESTLEIEHLNLKGNERKIDNHESNVKTEESILENEETSSQKNISSLKQEKIKLENQESTSQNFQKEEPDLKSNDLTLKNEESNNLAINIENSSEQIKNHEFIVKLFSELTVEDKTNKQLRHIEKNNDHPWFSQRNIQDSNESFEDFTIESIIKKANEDVTNAIRENNGVLPTQPDLKDKLSLIVDPNDEVLKLIGERKNILEEIQKIVKENKEFKT